MADQELCDFPRAHQSLIPVFDFAGKIGAIVQLRNLVVPPRANIARNLAGADMADPTLVFALGFTYWDAPPESGSTQVIATPTLNAFANTSLAASSNQGLTIVEGDLWFFAADGSSLEAAFAEQPYVDVERLRYFAGKYSLQAGREKTLREMFSNVLSDVPPQCAKIIVRVATSNEVAREHGWPDVETMKNSVNQALEAVVPDRG